MKCPTCGTTIAAGVSQCRHCGWALTTSPFPAGPGMAVPGPSVPSRVVSPVGNVGRALVVLLVLNAVALLAWTVAEVMAIPAMSLILAAAVLVIIWLYRARANIGFLGALHLGKGWAIGSWFCPLANLWFPLLIVGDIARVDLPAERQRPAAVIRYCWWACWLLAWFTSVRVVQTDVVLPDGSEKFSTNVSANFGGTVPSRILGAAAAVLLAVVVREISLRQEQRAAR